MQEHPQQYFDTNQLNLTSPIQSRCHTALANLTNTNKNNPLLSNHNVSSFSHCKFLDDSQRSTQSPTFSPNRDKLTMKLRGGGANLVQSSISEYLSNGGGLNQSHTPQGQRKSIVLEQENQQLKSQIEMLKAALLGLCKDQKLEIPGIMPILQQQLVLSIDTQNISSAFQTHQNQKENQLSPSRKYQNQNTIDQSITEFSTLKKQMVHHHIENDQEELFNITTNNSRNQMTTSISQTSSPVKSAQRRKRSDRKQSPLKFNNQMQQLTDITQESPGGGLREYLPLQIQSRKTFGNDETLVFDKSMEMQLRLDTTITNNNRQEERTPIQLNNINEDSVIICSAAAATFGDDKNCQSNTIEVEDLFKMNENSQIKLKYAKMLEELEQDTDQTQQINLDDRNSKFDFSIVGDQSNIQQQLYQKINQIPASSALENFIKDNLQVDSHRSQQIVQTEYYEQEINNLKTQLQLFNQEEQKILSLFDVSNENEDFGQKNETPNNQDETDLNHSNNYPQFQNSPEDNSCDRKDKNNNLVMSNLRRAFLDLQEILEQDQEDDLIKPVKILSPQAKVAEQEPQQLRQFINQQINSPQQKQSLLSSRQISADRQKIRSISPILNKSQKQVKDIKQQYQNTEQKIINQISQEFILNPEDNSVKSFNTIKSINVTQFTKKRKNLKQNKSHKDLHKSPSQFSMRKLIGQIAQDSLRIEGNKSCSPLKNPQIQQSRQPISHRPMTQQESDDSIDLFQRLQNMERLDLLAKRKSLAEGLIQQEEPNFSDEDDNQNKRNNAICDISQTPQKQTPKTVQICLKSEQSNEDFNNEPVIKITGFNSRINADDTLIVESGNTTGIARDKQELMKHISKRQSQLERNEIHYGIYNAEKSEKLKIQRNESIKKAEALLSQYLQEKSIPIPDSKRQTFISSVGNRQEESVEEQPCIIKVKQHSARYQENLLNEISFQEVQELEEHQNKPKIQMHNKVHSRSNSILSGNQDLVNLKIKPTLLNRNPSDTKTIQPQQDYQQLIPYFETFDNESPSQLATPLNIEINTQVHQIFDNKSSLSQHNFDEDLDIDYQVNQILDSNHSPLGGTDLMLKQSQIINNKRKSLEFVGANRSNTIQNKTLSNPLQNAKKRPITIKKQKDGHAHEYDGASNFNNFQSTSLSCEKQQKRKIQVLSKTIENLNKHEVTTITVQQSMVPGKSQKQTLIVEDPIIIQNTNQPKTIVDPEYYYQERSKSVIKRRDEIMRKKQQEFQNKLEQKFNKFEQIRQRNASGDGLQKGSHQRTSSNQKMNETSKALSHQQQNTVYHTRQKSIDSSSTTPIKQRRITNLQNIAPPQDHRLSQIQTQYKTNETISTTLRKQHSVGKMPIKFEKRSSNNQTKININDHQLNTISNLQTPIANQSVKSSQVPSTTESKSSKIVSECSSYRKKQQPPIYNQEHQEQKSVIVKHKQSNLKNNIVNRTVRLAHQTKPLKEYVQLKQELKMKQNVHQMIETQPQHVIVGGNEKSANQTQQIQFYSKSIQQPSILQTNNIILNSNKRQTIGGLGRESQKPQVVNSIQLSQSKSITRLSGVGAMMRESTIQQSFSSYSTAQKRESTIAKVQDQIEEFKLRKAMQLQQQEQTTIQSSECHNCIRLISKGLSTDFCLEHYGTPRCIDD